MPAWYRQNAVYPQIIDNVNIKYNLLKPLKQKKAGKIFDENDEKRRNPYNA